MTKGKSIPIFFIGIADFVNEQGQPFPVGPIDLFQLSQHKVHIIYPAITAGNEYIFSLQKEALEPEKLSALTIRIDDEEGVELSSISFSTVAEPAGKPGNQEKKENYSLVPIMVGASSLLLHVKIDSLVVHPGRYIVKASLGEEFQEIGEIYFHYKPTPPLTRDQINAIESDPRSFKAFRIDLGCKHCAAKLRVYTALDKLSNLEDEGYIWQYELEDSFKCDCGRTSYSLKYIKESLHGLLLRNFTSDLIGVGYIRRYAHDQVVRTVRDFEEKLKTEKNEEPFQDFIEQHPILLARFHAKRLFIKPKILGKFQTDFALLDTRSQLVLIELEKPSMKLFKKDGHPTADLMHAYGQVRDWLHEYSNHPAAVIDGLKLSDEKILAVKGIVIAGKRSNQITDALQRHLSAPPYADIDFLTLDDLSNSLFEISRNLG